MKYLKLIIIKLIDSNKDKTKILLTHKRYLKLMILNMQRCVKVLAILFYLKFHLRNSFLISLNSTKYEDLFKSVIKIFLLLGQICFTLSLLVKYISFSFLIL